MAGAVGTEVANGVATVVVDDPPVNALTDSVLAGLADAAGRIAADGDVRAVVLAGTGKRAFIAGADLKEFKRILGDREAMAEHVSTTRPVFDAWAALEVPVVAAVNAHAMGGGLEFALVCDFIVADPRAKFGLPEVTLGLMPGAGGTQRLARRVGLAWARRMALTGKPIDAEMAAAIGLADEIAEPGEVREAADAFAIRLAALPGFAIRSIKQALALSYEVPLAEGLDRERELFLEVTASADAREGAEAFLERREPRFEHR
jgi:enoyl-CoA hydratase/carnithine racemase